MMAGPSEGDWRLDRMRLTDVSAVVEIEKACFPNPWPAAAFRNEILSGDHSCCLVARRETDGPRGEPVGYVCYWILGEEVLINNLAVAPETRRRGIGELLLVSTLQHGRRAGCRVSFLEVRDSNEPAIRLYKASGFKVIGRRKGYYHETGEDALLMRACLATP